MAAYRFGGQGGRTETGRIPAAGDARLRVQGRAGPHRPRGWPRSRPTSASTCPRTNWKSSSCRVLRSTRRRSRPNRPGLTLDEGRRVGLSRRATAAAGPRPLRFSPGKTGTPEPHGLRAPRDRRGHRAGPGAPSCPSSGPSLTCGSRRSWSPRPRRMTRPSPTGPRADPAVLSATAPPPGTVTNPAQLSRPARPSHRQAALTAPRGRGVHHAHGAQQERQRSPTARPTSNRRRFAVRLGPACPGPPGPTGCRCPPPENPVGGHHDYQQQPASRR